MNPKNIILIVILLFSIETKAQMWCSPGATWYYNYSAFFTTGYYKIQYTGDTVINSITCQKLSKTIYSYSGNPKLDTTYIEKEYTYADVNKVYVFRLNNFYTLYDFSANVGDTIIIAGTNKYSSSCDSVGAVKVDSVGTMTINAQNLRYISVSPTATSKWGWKCRIVEKIGSIINFPNSMGAFSYLFPSKLDLCGLAVDEYPEGGSLRCYQDNTFGSYSSGISSSCNYIATEINELNIYSNFTISPNPTTDYINIQIDGMTDFKNTFISVFDVMGKLILKEKITQNQTQIQTTNFSNGLYFIQVENGNKVLNKKLIVQ